MMHADRVAFKANGNRHIYDYRMTLEKFKTLPDGNVLREEYDVDVYGAVNAKIMARTTGETIAWHTSSNGKFPT